MQEQIILSVGMQEMGAGYAGGPRSGDKIASSQNLYKARLCASRNGYVLRLLDLRGDAAGNLEGEDAVFERYCDVIGL